MATTRAERRLAAILAADVVGYSRLMERDEQGTLERLKAHRREFIDPLIADHRGRIVKLMGDGALVEFASVVDAVACAVAIQEGMLGREREMPDPERIRFRIGINLGDVIVEGEDIYGDGVNVAARLEGLAEPGGVCVSGKVREELRKRLELAFAPMGRQRVKNIAEPVEAWRVLVGGVPAARRFARGRTAGRRAMAAAVALLVLLAVGAGGWWWQASRTAGPPLPDQPSVAVLPLGNPAGDARLGRLADGMVENLIDDLSRLGLFVIARASSFAYRDQPYDPRRIGRELGVQYLVEGSLQGDGDRLRAAVRLVEADSGAQLWSERFDRPLDDLFAVQDELAQRIGSSIGGLYGVATRARLEVARRKPAEDVAAYDLVLLARDEQLRFSPAANAKALDLIRQAVALDPSSAAAHVELAFVHRQRVDNGWGAYETEMAGWLDAAVRAVELDPSNGWARFLLAQRYAYGNDQARYLAELERAAELAQGLPGLMALVGQEMPYAGQTARGLELVERAVRLDPLAVDVYRWDQSNVYFFSRRFEQAAAAVEAIRTPDNFDMAFAALIYAQLGRADDLERWRSRLKASDPDYSVERLFSLTGDFAPPATVERALFLESVAKAGLPRCATADQLTRYPEIEPLPECETERAQVAGRS